jgi:hypothetical protein
MSQTIPGYHVWEAAGKAVSVQMNLDALDRLSSVVLTGFGAIPRRGAEVGGVLVGTITGSVVRVDDFEPVPCSYKRGPSFLLTDTDAALFDEAYEKWRPGPGKEQYAVGFYRSNTRDQDTVSEDDREICAKYFPPPSNVMLFIKPYASKVSTAGFITYENGRLEDESAGEFPFRRFEIEGGTAPARRPLGESRSVARSEREMAPPPEPPPPARREPMPELRYDSPVFGQTTPQQQEPERAYALTAESRGRRKGWIWIPMSFIFLLLGVLLGFQAALTIYPQKGTATVAGDDPYSLNLSVVSSEDNLHVKWERQAGVIRAAQRGVLQIQDGTYNKQVELDATQLQNGSVIYRKLSGGVKFRLEVFPRNRVSVSESVEWKH